VAFDDVDRVNTRPGEKPTELKVAQNKKKERPLVDPKPLDFFTIDLAPFVNRSLRDDQPDDGQGGWTDQGGGCDMRSYTPGEKKYHGVPFVVLAPKSVVVLKSKHRPQSELPQKVSIPVGKKAQALYFLHDCAWCEAVEHFRYVVNYPDGSKREIPVVGEETIFDWGLGDHVEFNQKIPGLKAAVAETIGGNVKYPKLSVYTLEWLNPTPEKEIESIDFVSANNGVPILFAITGAKTREALIKTLD
jgi:hypothetical protein